MTSNQANQQKPKARNGKPLMSELLTDARKYIELAEQADVDSLRQFLFDDPERPLIAMGHGGSHSSAAYAALLYGTNCGLRRAMTPYQANSLSDATLSSTKPTIIPLILNVVKRTAAPLSNRSSAVARPLTVPCWMISFAYWLLKSTTILSPRRKRYSLYLIV